MSEMTPVTDADRIAALEAANAMMLREWQMLQPGGSPPPGDCYTLVPWIRQSVFEKFAALRDGVKAVQAAYSKHDRALCNYFAQYGTEHEEDDAGSECPEDDSCDCPLVVRMNESEVELRNALGDLVDVAGVRSQISGESSMEVGG